MGMLTMITGDDYPLSTLCLDPYDCEWPLDLAATAPSIYQAPRTAPLHYDRVPATPSPQDRDRHATASAGLVGAGSVSSMSSRSAGRAARAATSPAATNSGARWSWSYPISEISGLIRRSASAPAIRSAARLRVKKVWTMKIGRASCRER